MYYVLVDLYMYITCFMHITIFIIQHVDGRGAIEIKQARFELSLGDILIFTTGVPSEPPLGFSPNLTVRFTEGVYPRANTCVNALYLPLCNPTFDDFMYNMCFGILNSTGFGRL